MTLKVNVSSGTVYLTGTDINKYELKEPLELNEAYDLAVELLLAVQENMTYIKGIKNEKK